MKTEIAFIRDRSGSMGSMTIAASSGFSELLCRFGVPPQAVAARVSPQRPWIATGQLSAPAHRPHPLFQDRPGGEIQKSRAGRRTGADEDGVTLRPPPKRGFEFPVRSGGNKAQFHG